MSTTYHTVLRQIAGHCKALYGDATIEAETSYLIAPMTDAELRNDTPFNFTRLTDALLNAEEEFAWAIATTGNHPWRVAIRGITANLANNAVLPATDSNSKPIIGSWGTVYDASDNTPCVEMPLDVIIRRVRNANSHYVTPVYYYKIDGNLIRHTRTNVVIECCIYNRADQATALAANSAMLLPDVLEWALVARAAGALLGAVDGKSYADQADKALAGIKMGITSIPAKSVPVPITNVRAN